MCRAILLVLPFLFGMNPTNAQSFSEFLYKVVSVSEADRKDRLIQTFLSETTIPIAEGDSLHFLYYGSGRHVAVPGEMNGWDVSSGRMKRIPGTPLFYRTERFSPNARVEYKLWIDSTWILDPRNPRTAIGGFGENSEVRMPGYKSNEFTDLIDSTPYEGLETLWFSSRTLGRTHPVFIYTPPNIREGERLPLLLVTDGADYLSFGSMRRILSILISAKRIRPILAVFVDPRTDLNDPSTNHRMSDYAASDRYLDFLEKELVPLLESRYHVSTSGVDRLILGTSMGGLISTYAVLKREQFVSNCAAQSPAYWQAEARIMKLLGEMEKTGARVFIQTGSIGDTETESRLVSRMLREKGADVRFETLPEGHNWTNWRSNVGTMLEFFFPAR